MDGLLQVGSATLPGWFEVTAGPAAGRRVVVDEELRFGTEEAEPGTLEGDRWLSPSHAVIRRGAHGWTIEDLRSIEGTKVNGRPVRGATIVREGDVIELGSSRLVMVPEGGPAGPPGMDLRDKDVRNTGRRVLASLGDALVLLPFGFAFRYVAQGRYAVLIAWIAVWLTYNFLCDSLGGQTAGKWALGLRVVRIDGTPLKPSSVAARTVLRLASVVVPFVDVICIVATGKRRQRLGDLAAKTVVARATIPYAPPARRKRDRQVLIAYPLLWIAPAILLYLFVPAASLPSCGAADFQGLAPKEGSCVVGGRIVTLVETGHVLHLRGFDADLVATRTRPLSDAGSLVSFRVRVKNTSSAPLEFVPGRHSFLTVRGIDFRAQRTADDGPTIQPGAAARVWVRFAVPQDVIPQIGQPGSGLVFFDARDLSRFGAIGFWSWANSRGERALSGLTGG